MTKEDIAVCRVFAIVFGLAAALFAYLTLTVPMIAATAPAVITIAFVAAAILLWPRSH